MNDTTQPGWRRVCHLTSVHAHPDIRIFIKECCTLAAAGYEVHLVAVGTPDEMQRGVRLHGVPGRGNHRLARMTRTVWEVYRAALDTSADLYHFHDPELIPVGLLLRARGKRVIYDAHEDLPRDLLSKDYLGWASRLLSWPIEKLENFASRRFSTIVTATPTIGARFRSINPRTIVINNFPLLDELSPATPVAWNQRPPVVAYAGVITFIRGIAQMVDAMDYLPQHLGASLELAGRFASPELHDQMTRRPGWAYVRELGQLDRVSVAHLLGRARAGLVLFHPEPNHVNAQPNKMFEYMSAGLPIIASDFPLWREQIESTGCGLLVNPLDAQAVARAIEYLLTHPEEAEAMGRRGREAVQSHFNWEAESQKLLELYDRLLRPARN